MILYNDYLFQIKKFIRVINLHKSKKLFNSKPNRCPVIAKK